MVALTHEERHEERHKERQKEHQKERQKERQKRRADREQHELAAEAEAVEAEAVEAEAEEGDAAEGAAVEGAAACAGGWAARGGLVGTRASAWQAVAGALGDRLGKLPGPGAAEGAGGAPSGVCEESSSSACVAEASGAWTGWPGAAVVVVSRTVAVEDDWSDSSSASELPAVVVVSGTVAVEDDWSDSSSASPRSDDASDIYFCHQRAYFYRHRTTTFTIIVPIFTIIRPIFDIMIPLHRRHARPHATPPAHRSSARCIPTRRLRRLSRLHRLPAQQKV